MPQKNTATAPTLPQPAGAQTMRILLLTEAESRTGFEQAVKALFPGAELQLVLVGKEKAATRYSVLLLRNVQLVILATADEALAEQVQADCLQHQIPFSIPQSPEQAASAEVIAEDNAEEGTETSRTNWVKVSTYLIAAFCLMVTGHVLLTYASLVDGYSLAVQARDLFIGPFGLFVLTGFIAQLVDGSLGMGYGLVSATCLTSAGIPPVSMSATIHTAEIVTTGVSGYSHYRFGNVNKKLFRHLVIPGVFGAALGAVSLILLGDRGGKWLMPLVSLYALFLGVLIILRALQLNRMRKKTKRVGLLAWAGGFLDSFGGGGWGPIVTSTLIAGGRSAKYTIGSVGLTEFFITLTSAFTFFLFAGTGYWPVVAGLILGGLIAAPFGARLAGRLPVKPLLICVGCLAILWSLRNILKVFIA